MNGILSSLWHDQGDKCLLQPALEEINAYDDRPPSAVKRGNWKPTERVSNGPVDRLVRFRLQIYLFDPIKVFFKGLNKSLRLILI